MRLSAGLIRFKLTVETMTSDNARRQSLFSAFLLPRRKPAEQITREGLLVETFCLLVNLSPYHSSRTYFMPFEQYFT
ncbi:hypothetical protein ASY01nite_21300 [Acetobacter syzygii]|nr:hypothetical protein Absy_006_027 [Acetobacter syzygii]GEL57064.1 hypothetical protein ASY01nite_21300 [Acetobacter syzygii]